MSVSKIPTVTAWIKKIHFLFGKSYNLFLNNCNNLIILLEYNFFEKKFLLSSTLILNNIHEPQIKSSGPHVAEAPRWLKKILLCQFGLLRLNTARAAFISLSNISMMELTKIVNKYKPTYIFPIYFSEHITPV